MPAANEILEPEERTSVEPAPRPAISFLLRWANFLFFIPMVVLATICFGTVSLIVGMWDKDGSQQHWLARQWARVLLRVALSPVKLVHAERLHASAAVYASNHLSYYDTPVLFA
jgi:1-acyl-sn-glycerol-3-phosphate acyltransferase